MQKYYDSRGFRHYGSEEDAKRAEQNAARVGQPIQSGAEEQLAARLEAKLGELKAELQALKARHDSWTITGPFSGAGDNVSFVEAAIQGSLTLRATCNDDGTFTITASGALV